ncbi:phage tail protein [Pseudomonas brassicacearum]|uniref:phage tail protein n=1 Tax=Pseudomonas brassicacearum TaxID=930166 RepID=UPI000F4AF2AE|nr:tail fiber protein [Pseudomonas brassicacearum]
MPRQPFNTRWAQGVESEDNLNSFKAPGDVRISTGWEGGQDKDAPPAGQENWWHNRTDTALQGIERNGVMSWHPQTIYGLGAPTYGSDGNYYESLQSENTGNDPVSTIGFWRYRGASFFSGHEPGDLKMVAHNNIPSSGWLKCNGAVLLRSSYQLLFSAIGTAHNIGGETNLQFRLPDYRGEFVRGFDDGRGVDPGRVFGSYQKGSLTSFDPTVLTPALSGLHTTSSDASIRNDIGLDVPVYSEYPEVNVVTGTPSQTFGVSAAAGASRPRNKTVNYWIKY